VRTNIVIVDKLMSEALKVTGLSAKKEVVELRLKLIVRQNKQQARRKWGGKHNRDGDLDEIKGKKWYCLV